MNLPAFSVVMPVRNGANFLSTSIRCIETNVREGDEIIVIDDHSIDETFEILKQWQSVNSQVRVMQNDGEGLVDALNCGITSAKNEWIARFDVDDEYLPHRLQAQRDLLNEKVVAVFSDYSLSRHGKIIDGIIPSPLNPFATKISLVHSQRTAHSSAVFRKNSAIEAGLYKNAEHPAEDLGLWWRLSAFGDLVSCSEPLLQYRLNPDGITSRSRQEMIKVRESLTRINCQLYLDFSNLSSEIKSVTTDYADSDLATLRMCLFYFDLISALRINGRLLVNSHILLWHGIRIAIRPDIFSQITKILHLRYRKNSSKSY